VDLNLVDLNLTVDTLGTVAGLAVVIALFLQLLLKPGLVGSEEKPWYGIAINACGFVLALVLGILYQWAKADLNALTTLGCFVKALAASASAIFGYEVVKNVRAVRNGT
jgi:hypothetical protein